jgi:hypothetical protein
MTLEKGQTFIKLKLFLILFILNSLLVQRYELSSHLPTILLRHLQQLPTGLDIF